MHRHIWALSVTLGLLFSLIAPVVQAAPSTTTLAREFATCLGRYAAQEDYDRLMGRDVTDAAARAVMFGEMLQAIAPTAPEAAHTLTTSRKGAAGAHWTLLQSADFSDDARLARHARRTARRNIAMCEMLVLS